MWTVKNGATPGEKLIVLEATRRKWNECCNQNVAESLD